MPFQENENEEAPQLNADALDGVEGDTVSGHGGITIRVRTDDDPEPDVPVGAASAYVARHESDLERALAALEAARAEEYGYADGFDPGAAPGHIEVELPIESYAGPAPEIGIESESLVSDSTTNALPPQSRIVNFATLAAERAPEFRWFVPGWLSPHPTLMSGKGGMGKSLAALQMAVSLAAGKRFLTEPVDPLRVVLWSCEEDLPELHRRLERICEFYQIDMASLGEHLTIDCRQGLENTLITQEFGRAMWTPLAEYLRQQVNDLRADIWIGDNVAHLYACSENDRHPVTTFTSFLAGMRDGWCPLLIGHVAKIGGSEYSGSTAWENAVRMRWYLGDRLPEEDKNADDPEDGEPGNVRFLCKRKTNYDQKDYVRFTMQDGILVPEKLEVGDTGLVAALRHKKAQDVVLRGLATLTERGINTSERGGQANLPKLILEYGLGEGCSPKQLVVAMRALISEGRIVRGETGRDASRRKREGLILVTR